MKIALILMGLLFSTPYSDEFCIPNPMLYLHKLCIGKSSITMDFTQQWKELQTPDPISKEIKASMAQAKDNMRLLQLIHTLPYFWCCDERQAFDAAMRPGSREMLPGGEGDWPGTHIRYRQDYYLNQSQTPDTLKTHIIAKIRTPNGDYELIMQDKKHYTLKAHDKTPKKYNLVYSDSRVIFELPKDFIVQSLGIGVVKGTDELLSFWPKKDTNVLRDWRLLKTGLVLPLSSVYNAQHKE